VDYLKGAVFIRVPGVSWGGDQGEKKIDTKVSSDESNWWGTPHYWNICLIWPADVLRHSSCLPDSA
jgi:hypothetical protein